MGRMIFTITSSSAIITVVTTTIAIVVILITTIIVITSVVTDIVIIISIVCGYVKSKVSSFGVSGFWVSRSDCLQCCSCSDART